MDEIQTPEVEVTETSAEPVAEPESTEPDTTETTEPADAPAPTLFKVKVDGQEFEVSQDELIRGYQLRQAADKRMAEAAELRKHTEALVLGLKEEPIEILKAMGVDVDFITESYLANKLQRELMDPKDRELEETRLRLQQYEQAEQEKARIETERQQQAEIERHGQELDQSITQALTASNLPRSAYSASRVIDIMLASHNAGQPLTPEQAVPLVMSEYKKEFGHFVETLEGEALLEFLGDKGLKKVRQAEVAKVKNPIVARPTRPSGQNQTSSTPPASSWEEFSRKLRELQYK